MRINKSVDDMESVKKKLVAMYGFTSDVHIHRFLLKPNLEIIEDINLLDNNDRVYLDLRIRVNDLQ